MEPELRISQKKENHYIDNPPDKVFLVFLDSSLIPPKIPDLTKESGWMDWAVDATDLTQEPILESLHEYQDNEFIDKLSVSDSTYPLILLILVLQS